MAANEQIPIVVEGMIQPASKEFDMTGKVKWYSSAKGFGFVTGQDGKELLFLHQSEIVAASRLTLKDGDEVEYVPLPGSNGPKATQVRPVAAAPLCDPQATARLTAISSSVVFQPAAINAFLDKASAPSKQPENAHKLMVEKDTCEAFICAKSADYGFARQVFEHLVAHGIHVFLSDESLPQLGNSDYRKEIDRVLDQTRHMVVVTSSQENVESPWVEAEWGFFINEKRSGRKRGNLVTMLVEGLLPERLPPSLRCYEALALNAVGLGKLLAYMR